jgi:DNA adenine methylase
MAKPFLKWVGGKTQLLENVLALFPTTLKDYYEPFVGGGSVLLGFLSEVRAGTKQVQGSIYASDLNPHLIALYKHIQSEPTGLLHELRKLQTEFSAIQDMSGNQEPMSLEQAKTSQESYYYWIRKLFNENRETHTLEMSARMVFLNKVGFRGVYRENKDGEFNVPFGHNKKPTLFEEQNIMAVSQLLQGVTFVCEGFEGPLSKATQGDFVYLDPPYAKEQGTSFTAYQAGGFPLASHTKLFELCQQMRQRKVKFLMSNADVPLVQQAFPTPPYTRYIVIARRAIHSKDPSTQTNEVLILDEAT